MERNLKLRDLLVFSTVAKCGSMGKAAAQLGVKQPSISESVADLEHLCGVTLFDRSPRGVELTAYGAALLRRSVAIFDEIRESGKDIESIADPARGELRIASVESITATILPLIIQSFRRQFPRVVLHVENMPGRAEELAGLRKRRHDLALLRMHLPHEHDPLERDPMLEDEKVEPLFDDELVIAVGAQSAWARRRKIELARLTEAPWILTAPATWNYDRVADLFLAVGLPPPNVTLVTQSVHLRAQLAAHDSFVTAIPRSLMLVAENRRLLRLLPIQLPRRRWPVAIVTLGNRTLSATARRFMEIAREVAASTAARA
jgi:DNA-binding transcriptional LysR family regulator